MDYLMNAMILIDGVPSINPVAKCYYMRRRHCYSVRFCHGNREYFYGAKRITVLKNPVSVSPDYLIVSHRSEVLSHIRTIWEYRGAMSLYWRIVFENGAVVEYDKSNLEVRESCLQDEVTLNVLHYFEQVAAHNALAGDDNMPLLLKQYRQIQFLDRRSAAACYLNPTFAPMTRRERDTLIYPFGCNASQKQAVERAFENQISVIEGPPGTGKTQTILNIIANIICKGQTVMVVSNSNSAIENVAEKLEQRHYGFMVAELGSSKNKEMFLAMQAIDKLYPHELMSWKNKAADSPYYLTRLEKVTQNMCVLFKKQEELSHAKQEYRALELEKRHFHSEVGLHISLRLKSYMPSRHLIRLWQTLQRYEEEGQVSAWKSWWRNKVTRLKAATIFLNGASKFLQLDTSKRIAVLQSLYYEKRMAELHRKIKSLEELFSRSDSNQMLEYFNKVSTVYFNHTLYKRYGGHRVKPFFTPAMIRQNPAGFLHEFPVVLSTTFSSRNNFSSDVLFDYVIMDEASQVSSETGLLALTCARNAVIVGDSMQLPNVVTQNDIETFGALAEKMNIPEEYDCTRYSFLDSLCRVVKDVPQTLLREHYRCHPKIIEFCNQKFYDGRLICMTEDKGEKEVMTAIRTVRGNHSRDRMNQREIDVIDEEVLPILEVDSREIGIIAPYNHQVDELQKQLSSDADIATVHKFQGREKDTIILSAVDDVITPFSDDAHLLNVAISRARHHFCLVMSGNEQPQESNISDSLGYIKYNNFTISDSKVRSIFDYLYQPYTESLRAFLKRHRHISEYASENLTFALLEEILSSRLQYSHLGIICHQSLGLLIGDNSLMTPDEQRYVSHADTHIDFLLYNRVSKRAVLAIETDGYAFHKNGSRQAERDAMKNDILTKYGIPFLRLSTAGSNERRCIESKLQELLPEQPLPSSAEKMPTA